MTSEFKRPRRMGGGGGGGGGGEWTWLAGVLENGCKCVRVGRSVLGNRVCNRLSGYSGYSHIRKNLSVRIAT